MTMASRELDGKHKKILLGTGPSGRENIGSHSIQVHNLVLKLPVVGIMLHRHLERNRNNKADNDMREPHLLAIYSTRSIDKWQ